MDKEKNKGKPREEFDRSICFTFFKSFHDQIMDIKAEFGTEAAFEVYEAIASYGLYQKEIKDRKIRILIGNPTIEQIDKSQERRSKGFSGENYEMTKVVAEYMRDHPGTSQRAIAEATGIGKTKVGKVQKKIKDSGLSIDEYLNTNVYPNLTSTITSTYTNTITSTITSRTETEGDHCDQCIATESVPTESASSKLLPNVADAPNAPQATQNKIKEFDFKCASSLSNKRIMDIINIALERLYNDKPYLDRKDIIEDIVAEFSNNIYMCDALAVREYMEIIL